MAVSSSTLNLTAGQASTLTVTVTPANGFDLAIALSCSGLPQGATFSFFSLQHHSQRCAGHEHGEHPGSESNRARAQ